MHCTVVKEDVPLLLPIRLLRDLDAVIDLGRNQLKLKDTLIPMNTLPSGHASVDVLDFGVYKDRPLGKPGGVRLSSTHPPASV